MEPHALALSRRMLSLRISLDVVRVGRVGYALSSVWPAAVLRVCARGYGPFWRKLGSGCWNGGLRHARIFLWRVTVELGNARGD